MVTEYIYTYEERLISVKRDGQTLASYAYNPSGRRVKKTVNGNTTWYLYNPNGLAAEYSSSGQLLKEYHFHPQKTWMTDPLFQRTSLGEVYYYYNDHLGTPQQMLDGLGNIVWRAQYSVFGKAHVVVDTVENNLRFPGQYFDVETGLHQNYFRDYDSELGRYIHSDPIGLAGGVNTFLYGNANPMMMVDPKGLSSCLGECISQQLGIGDLVVLASVGAGMPFKNKRFKMEGATKGTSILSSMIGNWGNVKRRIIPAPTYNKWGARTNFVGRAVARWIPIVGTAVLVHDAYQIVNCTLTCERDEDDDC